MEAARPSKDDELMLTVEPVRRDNLKQFIQYVAALRG